MPLLLSTIKTLPLVLLIILGVFIVISALLLAVPFRYELRGTNIGALRGMARVAWLFKMLVFEAFIRREEKMEYRLRLKLFGRTLWKGGGEFGGDALEEEPPGEEPPEEFQKPPDDKPRAETVAPPRRIKLSDLPPVEDIPEEEAEPEEEEEGPERLSLKYFLHMPDRDKLIKACLKLISGVLKETRPREVYLRARIGTGDPAMTGKILGAACIISGYFSQDIIVTPDFENPAAEFNFKITGRIVTGRILFMGVRFILTKPVWRIIKLYRKGKSDKHVK